MNKLAVELSGRLFEKCVEKKLMKDGSLEIRCKQGLWSVSGANHAVVMREAQHYWQQYFTGGEYNHILPNTQ